MGCASSGRKIDSAAASQIKVGRTTKKQVSSLIGSPDGTTTNGRGDTIWTYNYMGSQVKPQSFIPYVGPLLEGTRTQQQAITVVFGPSGVVKDFSNSESASETGVNLGASGPPKQQELNGNKRPL